jgi:hypothetical protein
MDVEIILFARHSTKFTSHSSEGVSSATKIQSLPWLPQTLKTQWLGYTYRLLLRYTSEMQGFVWLSEQSQLTDWLFNKKKS